MEDRLTRIASGLAITAGVAGVGAAAYVCARHLRSVKIQNEHVTRVLETLSSEVQALRREIADLRAGNSGLSRSASNNRTRFREEGGGGDTSISSRLNRLYGRVKSYQSLTSDGEYADAEEDWENDFGDGQPPIPLTPMSYEDIDQMYGTENIRQGYSILKNRYEGGDKSSNLLWRLAKFSQELASRSVDKEVKKSLTFEGRSYALEGHRENPDDFDALKWAAIMTGAATDFLPTKEKIEEGAKFKQLLDEAIIMNDKDFSLLYMRGRYSYAVANLSWFERRAAAMLYSTPPNATVEEALEDFLAAYEQSPEWIKNLLFIIRIYSEKNDKENTEKYCNKMLTLTPNDDEDRERMQEAKAILAKC
ncbi:unnamed protein product [Cylicocyclus nassatus]|uniref:Regulator of microtubule dynamics protein 1 n=1 Tax=Cylicocyclus nassatus TaxID=53992 RepID=A0AA36GH99_CYLNA|nr:unnamed protein product [Cylicocyclus nassatus]